MSEVGIIDYGMGNLHSVLNAVDYLGFDCDLVNSPEKIHDHDRIILPGVGSYARAMSNLEERGYIPHLTKYIKSGRPLLGICLGMHLLSSLGTEPTKTKGLNYISGKVGLIPVKENVPLPHVGWNSIELQYDHPVFKGARVTADYYFVHSYCFMAEQDKDILGFTQYDDQTFVSAVARGNIIGLQFHPEKSQVSGLRLLENFCDWDGKC